MKALLLAACASLPLAVRRDSPHIASQVSQDGHHVSWGKTLGEDIGFEVELVFGSLVNAMLWPSVVDKGVQEIAKGLQQSGLNANVRANGCRCSKWVQGQGYVVPLYFAVKGVGNFDVFNAKSLGKVKASALEVALKGSPKPGGGYAKDSEPVEAQLRAHPAVGNALKRFSLLDAGGLKLTLAVEFWESELAKQDGSTSPSALLEKMWGQITGLYWQKLHDGGIDCVIAGVEHAKDTHPQSYDEVKKLSDRGAAACITAPDFKAIAAADNGQVSLWEGTESGRRFLGFRAAVTLLSANVNINARGKLPELRNDVMEALMSPTGEDLPGKLRAYRVQSNVVPCGWTPSDPSAPPLPHDVELCREPPNF